MTDYKAIDFFCGGGGMTCGLRQAGINVIAGVDFDPQCKETYETNNPTSKFIEANIKELPTNYFEKEFSIEKDDDKLILIACSPCQYYSIINTTREKSKESKDLLMDFKRFVAYYNPGYLSVENVPGIVTNKESILPDFLNFLRERKYVVQYKVVDMSYYGIPQSRKRFSLIASRIDENINLPNPDEKQTLLEDFIGVKNGFQPIKAGHKDKTDFNHTVSGLNEICTKRLEKTPRNGGSRLSWKDDKKLQLKCFEGKDSSFKDTFGRMWWKKPAPTITTKFFSISNGRFAHPEEDRAISLREGATLQTFPKDYVFKTTSIGATAKLIGNAVPPEYARRIGEIIVNSQNR
ncbi:MAG: DNA cytosine methyltransferase [Prevotellaceae bacterium]|jgi:DNA (cytosine-5)-methyltransferase 1|nr:DNA cytosine methyltransferase [Prevotellaceae bacterium]